MTTNIISLPVITATVEISANEDWRDTFIFVVAASAIGFAATGNAGNATIGDVDVVIGADVDTYTVKVFSVGATKTTFGLVNSSGDTLAFGTIGVLFSQAGLTFTIQQGNVPAAAGDSFQIIVLGGPLDITDIEFELTVRDQADDIAIVLVGSTDDFSLINGGAGGTLGTDFPVTFIENITPALYLFDVRAKSAGITKRAISGTLNVVAAVTI